MLMRRNKGILTLVLVVSFFLYVNWFISISNWSLTGNDLKHHQHSVEFNFIKNELKVLKSRDGEKTKHASVVFELFEAYEANEKALQSSSNKLGRYDQFLLIVDSNQDSIHKVLASESESSPLDAQELASLLKILHLNKAYLVEKNMFADIKFKDTGVNVSEPLKAFNVDQITYQVLTIDKLKQSSQERLVTFGIDFNNVESLNKNILKSLPAKCEYIQSGSEYNEKRILSSLYITCDKLTIQVAIFYTRGSFLWVSSDSYAPDLVKVFGDKTRAINKFNLTQISDQEENLFYIPADLKRFSFEYNHSLFIECNRNLANLNLRKLGSSHNQNLEKNKMVLPVIKHISETLESNYKHYWLAGGTLLGWYRDCGIIPFTQDVDMAVWAHEFEVKIKRHFLGNKIVRVWGTLGLMNDSYELRLYNDLFTFDLFLVYKNQSSQWCGYQVNRSKFKRTLPDFNQLCSADLLNHKFMVPCNPVHYLDRDYGPVRWQTPQSVNYTWSNVRFWEKWSDSLWPHTIKYYDRQGKLIKKKILDYVNKHMSKPVSQVPLDDDADIMS